MQKTILLLIICILPKLVFSQKIKSISEFLKEGNQLIKTNYYTKNKQCNKIVYFFGYDSIAKSLKEERCYLKYDKNRKQSESCFVYYSDLDSLSPSGYMTALYDDREKTKTFNFFFKDSIVYSRHILKTNNKKLETSIQYLWFKEPMKERKIEDAIIVIDTFEINRKGKWLKRIHYNSDFPEEVYTESYTYKKDGYILEKKGFSSDTIISHTYHKLQSVVDQKGIEYEFLDSDKYSYTIEYY